MKKERDDGFHVDDYGNITRSVESLLNDPKVIEDMKKTERIVQEHINRREKEDQ